MRNKRYCKANNLGRCVLIKYSAHKTSSLCLLAILVVMLCTSCSRLTGPLDNIVKESELFVSDKMIDLGVIREDEPIDTMFVLINTSPEQRIIHKVHFSCGCTTSDFLTPKVLNSGDACEIPVRFDPKGFIGETIRELTLITSDKYMPRKTVRLKAYVKQNNKSFSCAPAEISLGIVHGDSWKKAVLLRLPYIVSVSDLVCETSSPSIEAKYICLDDKSSYKFDYDVRRIPNRDQYQILCIYSDGIMNPMISEWVKVKSKNQSFEEIELPIRGINIK